jgi:putative copper export protein
MRGLGTLLLLALAGGLLFASRSEAARAALLPSLRVVALAAPVAVAAELLMWTTHVAGSLDFAASVQLATGRALLARIVFAVVALLVLLVVRSLRGAAFTAFVAVLVGGALGHAGAASPALSIPLRAVHLAAAAVWLGGLLALGRALRGVPAQRSLLTDVSTAALASFIVVAITGAGQALLLLGSVDALLQTTYGRLVLAKATGLLLLASFGYLHRRMIALVPEAGDAGALRRSVTVETLVFIALILVSGALSFAQLPE